MEQKHNVEMLKHAELLKQTHLNLSHQKLVTDQIVLENKQLQEAHAETQRIFEAEKIQREEFKKMEEIDRLARERDDNNAGEMAAMQKQLKLN